MRKYKYLTKAVSETKQLRQGDGAHVQINYNVASDEVLYRYLVGNSEIHYDIADTIFVCNCSEATTKQRLKEAIEMALVEKDIE